MPDFDIDKLRNVVLQFNIPMAFDLLNCLNPTDKGKPFLLAINGIPAKIHLQRVYEYRYRDEGIQFAPFSKIEEDRGGMLSYSNVQIWFDSHTFDSDRIDKSVIRLLPEQFIDLSIGYLNRFIKSYRLVTNEYWLRPLSQTDILNIHYILIDTESNQERIEKMIQGPHPVTFSGGREFQLPDESEELLRSILMSEMYDFGKEFLLNLTDNLTLGYYNIALVQAVTFFEYFVHSSLKQTLSKTKLNEINRKEGCGCLVGISEICERGILTYFGVDFGGTEEFKALRDNALKYRNPIVHGELLESIDKEKCDKAIASVEKAQAYLIQNVFSKV